MALGPQYAPPGLEQILAQLDNAAIMERARNVGLGDLLGGGGASMPTNPGSIPINAGYGTGAASMPYGYGSLETPTTEALLEAIRRRGVYAGGRGFLKGTGQPLGLPRATSAAEVQAGIYGGNPSAINANVIPVTQPSPIPPGAGRGASAANMPYAQWQQASDELVNAVQRQGPYAGTRGWGRSSGPAYMAETGFPRQLALPSGQIPSQTGLGNMSEVGVARPGSIPAGAGRGTGIGDLPYQGAYEMPAVYEAPMRQSTLRNQLRNGVQSGAGMDFSNPRTSALAQSVDAIETPVSIRGRNTPNWRSFQGGENGVGAAGFPTADYVPPVPGASTGGGNLLTRNASWIGAERAAAEGAPSLGRNFARGIMGQPALGVEGAKPGLMARAAGGAGRGAVVMGVPMAAGMAADRLGQDSVGGQFAQGYALGGGFGGIFGLPGSVVGGLGIGLGNVGANAVSGKGIESLWGGGDNGPQGVIKDYLTNQQVTDPTTGEQTYSPQAQVVIGLLDPEINMMAQMGIPDEQAQAIQERVNSQLAGTNSQEERIGIVKDAADELLSLTEASTSSNQMSPSDIAAMQIMASQMMAPVAADAVTYGNMRADALQGLMPSLPEAYQQPVQSMINQAVPRSQRVANAYIQQAYSMPQLDVLQGYQNQVNQTAQQLTAQALSNQMTGGGGSDLASLIAGANGNSGDIVSALAGG